MSSSSPRSSIAAVVNAAQNLAHAHIASGFGFWNNTAGFDISQTLIPYSSSTSTFGRAFWVGLLNTLLVAAHRHRACDRARLCRRPRAACRSNWLVARLAGGYVELIRNVPLLLQLLFWYNAVLKALPELRDSVALPGGGFLNNRGLFLPRPDLRRGISARVIAALLVGIAAAIALAVCRQAAAATAPATGAPTLWPVVGLVVVLPLAVFALAGAPLAFSFPQMGRFNVRGGIEILPELAALLVWRCRSIRRPSSPKSCAPACWRFRTARPRRRRRSACAPAPRFGSSSCRRRCG